MAYLKLPKIDGGINLAELEHKIKDNQSPDMKNVWYKDRTLSKRWGQEKVSFTDGTGPVSLTNIYGVSAEYEDYVCIHADTKLYKWNTTTNVLTDLGVTVNETESAFVEFNGYLYCFDGAEIWVIDSSWVCAAVVPHVPVVFINCTPDRSSSKPNEAYNLIGAGFTVWYNGDGTSTEYSLPLTDLDSTEIKVYVDGSLKTLTTDYTWNQSTGVVTFTAAPSTDTNNVKITAYKTIAGNKAKITSCKIAIPFGGMSSSIYGGSRLFVMKNPSDPKTYWWSDLGASQSNGATYFPDDQYEELTQNNDEITAAAKQAGNLIILKEKSLFTVSYQFDGETVFYPVREFNSVIGCDIPKSVQLIDNNLVFANTYGGVFVVVNTSSSAEENVKPISNNINGIEVAKGLLQESNLATATSVDHDRKYWLCVNGNVYMWDYDLTPLINYADVMKSQRRLAWFKLDNINASFWLSFPTANDTGLWYSDGSDVIHFIHRYTDFGEGINSYWKSKSFDFEKPATQKKITIVNVSIRADSYSHMTVTVSNESKTSYYSKTIGVLSYSWVHTGWATGTWTVQRFSKPYRLKPKMKKKYYCQIWVTDDTIYRDMGITDMEIIYEYGKMVR